MELSTQGLQKLVDRENKKAYKTVYSLVQQQVEDVHHGLLLPLDDDRQKVLGTCGIYLRSIAEMLHTIKKLLEEGFVESAGIMATALWERAITLRKILLAPQENSQIHTEHEKGKKTP